MCTGTRSTITFHTKQEETKTDQQILLNESFHKLRHLCITNNWLEAYEIIFCVAFACLFANMLLQGRYFFLFKKQLGSDKVLIARIIYTYSSDNNTFRIICYEFRKYETWKTNPKKRMKNCMGKSKYNKNIM